MHMSLFVLGFVTAAAGFVTIGFGIPINAFSLGNTLIIAGTIAVVGGFILIGLGAAVRQLRRIAEAGGLHPSAIAPSTSTQAPEPVDPQAQFLSSQFSQGIIAAP